MTEKRASEIMERTVINGDIHPNTAEYMEALEISIDKLGADYTREQLENWILINKYPFLLPRNEWTGEIPEHYDYLWTYLDDIPIGWKNAFGEMFCEELKNELIRCNCLEGYYVVQAKEKFGQLRWYDNDVAPVGSRVNKIIDKYSVLSENICARCGKPDVPMTYDGWWIPLCEKCYCQVSYYYKENHTKEEIDKRIIEKKKNWEKFNKENNKMRDYYILTKWNKESGETKINYDISETANKIKKKYYGQNN